MIKETVIALTLLGLEPFGLDKETPEQRTERANIEAHGISQAASWMTCGEVDPQFAKMAERHFPNTHQAMWASGECKPLWKHPEEELVAYLITVGFWESRFAEHVYYDKCRIEKLGECDKGRAKNVFQVHQSEPKNAKSNYFISKDAWTRMGGGNQFAFQTAALGAAVILTGNRMCGVSGTFSAYAIGKCEGFGQEEERTKTYKTVLKKLKAGSGT